MADNEDLGLGSEEHLDGLDENGVNEDGLLHDGDPELEAIKARVREMEEEAEKLKQLQSDVDKQMNMGSPPGFSKSSSFLFLAFSGQALAPLHSFQLSTR